jgi:hypothetical protein
VRYSHGECLERDYELRSHGPATLSVEVLDTCLTKLWQVRQCESRLEGEVNRANLKFINLSTTTSRVSVRNVNESEREGKNKSRANKE